jgi:hypothetical protein
MKSGFVGPFPTDMLECGNRIRTFEAVHARQARGNLQLLATLNAAVPFDVELPPALIVHLLAQHTSVPVNRRHSISKVSYLGDEGGIVCHIVPEETDNVLVVSLTHVRVHRSLPFSTACTITKSIE